MNIPDQRPTGGEVALEAVAVVTVAFSQPHPPLAPLRVTLHGVRPATLWPAAPALVTGPDRRAADTPALAPSHGSINVRGGSVQ